MHPALWISKSGLDAQQTDISVISHNLANVNTTGYKKSRAVFQDLMYQKIRQPGSESDGDTVLPSGLMLGTGVRVTATQKDFAAGNPMNTDNPLHLSINGAGFFRVTRADGSQAYTRDGNFQLNSDGDVVNSEGLLMSPGLSVGTDAVNVTIGKTGVFSVTVAGAAPGTAPTTTQMNIYTFINPAGLEPVGDNLFIPTTASGTAQQANPGSDGAGTISQGTLEASNVNVVEELVNLIQTQRAYEMNAKSVETVDGMLRFVTQVL